jgi:hypothetical protein
VKCTCYCCHKRRERKRERKRERERERKRKASCIFRTLKTSCLLELLWSVLMLET